MGSTREAIDISKSAVRIFVVVLIMGAAVTLFTLCYTWTSKKIQGVYKAPTSAVDEQMIMLANNDEVTVEAVANSLQNLQDGSLWFIIINIQTNVDDSTGTSRPAVGRSYLYSYDDDIKVTIPSATGSPIETHNTQETIEQLNTFLNVPKDVHGWSYVAVADNNYIQQAINKLKPFGDQTCNISYSPQEGTENFMVITVFLRKAGGR